jgi:serpin B
MLAGFVAAMLAACGSSAAKPQPAPRTATAGARAAVTASNGLALELLRLIGSGAGANTVFSPYSIQAALSMADVGAGGRTAAQINHVLGTPAASSLAAANATLAARLGGAVKPPANLKRGDAAALHIANGLWVASGLPLKDAFSGALAGDFGARPQQLDFAGNASGARATINSWVAARTANRIKNLMPPPAITTATKLVLANAIYLKAHWMDPFDTRATARATFFLSSGGMVVKPQFMRLPDTNLQYASGRSYQAVDLPYLGSTLSMLLVMPKTLPAFQAHLTLTGLARIERALAPVRVRLQMPKLHLTVHADLVHALSTLGMPIAFTDNADFSGITARVPLKIGAVEHGADLTVDEQGTVATAATGVSFLPTAVAPSAATNLTLNHPFLLFLRDDRSGAILFAGRVSDPTRS